MSTPTALAANLRSAREALGWSRATLARKSGTSTAAIARTELYGKQPRIPTVRAWAGALGTTIAVLLDEAEAASA